MVAAKLTHFLDWNGIGYTVLPHPPAYTALEIAESAHVTGRRLAKTVIVQIDNKLAMVVLPASQRVNMALLRQITHGARIALAREDSFADRFPDCEPGAMPPFGNLYHMEVFASDALTRNDAIVFNAGSHQELIQLRYEDFERLVQPRIVNFS